MINTINEARTPGELAAWLRQWADGADASDHLDDNDARQLAEAVERVCAPGNAACEAWKKICAACAEGTPPERCAYYGEPNGCNAPTLGKHPEGDLAERLQEALEKAERRIEELERTLGNAAEMREALDKAECVLLVAARFATDNAFTDADARGNLRDVDWDGALAEIDAALAAPARNCDVGTAEEQQERFREFCRRHEAAGECGIGLTQAKCPCWRGPKNPDCALAWAQMPFAPAERGAEVRT